MTEARNLEDILTALMEGQSSATAEDSQAAQSLAAGLKAALDEADSPTQANAETLAALIDGGLTPDQAVGLLATPTGRALVEAALAFAEDLKSHTIAPPSHLVADARARLAGPVAGVGAEVIPLRRPAPRVLPPAETFQLLAAASGSEDQAIVCHSTTGLWTLQTFPGLSAADRAAGRASLLVTVNTEHAASYEGLKLKAFVTIGGEERVLAEDFVRDGSVFAEISLAGLDLRSRDPVSVVFSAAAED